MDNETKVAEAAMNAITELLFWAQDLKGQCSNLKAALKTVESYCLVVHNASKQEGAGFTECQICRGHSLLRPGGAIHKLGCSFTLIADEINDLDRMDGTRQTDSTGKRL